MQENIIEVKNLTKRFKDFVAVDDVLLMLKKEKFLVFWDQMERESQQQLEY
jgi:ABC-type Fe3+/spermidine/putrescine transport system ATPase subunit